MEQRGQQHRNTTHGRNKANKTHIAITTNGTNKKINNTRIKTTMTHETKTKTNRTPQDKWSKQDNKQHIEQIKRMGQINKKNKHNT